MFDYLIVGAGFAGSVLAERLASEAGKKVLIVDRRGHIGGNAYDHYNDEGVLVHRYGPHIFHTNSREVFEYLSRFTEWRPYMHRVLASVDGQLVPMPINLNTINQLYGLSLNSFELEKFFESVAEPREELRTSEDVVVSKVGRLRLRGLRRAGRCRGPGGADFRVQAGAAAAVHRGGRVHAGHQHRGRGERADRAFVRGASGACRDSRFAGVTERRLHG